MAIIPMLTDVYNPIGEVANQFGSGGSRLWPTKIRVPAGLGFGTPKLNKPCGAVGGMGWVHSSAAILFISDTITARFSASPTLTSPAPFSHTMTPRNRDPGRSIKLTVNLSFFN